MIKTVLEQMDHSDDSQWTADGLPKLDIIATILEKKVKRQEVTDALPDFRRVVEVVEEVVEVSLTEQLADVDAQIGKLQQQRKLLSDQLDEQIEQNTAVNTSAEFTHGIQDFLKSQQKQRAAKVGRKQKLNEQLAKM